MLPGNLIKHCANLTAKLLTSAYKSKVVKLKLDEDLLQCWFYLLFFVNSLKILLTQCSETYILVMDHPSIKGEERLY